MLVRASWLATLGLGIAAGCGVGALGAPCDIDSDCDDGLTCDLHASAGSCQRAHVDANEPVARDCSIETRADTYSLGLRHSGAWATVELLDAMPSPPSRGDNTWVVRVLDDADVPQGDVLVTVDPFMPDHGHGSTIRCHVDAGDEPGTFVLSPVNMFMPGLWEVTLDIAGTGHPDDAVMFSFCIDP